MPAPWIGTASDAWRRSTPAIADNTSNNPSPRAAQAINVGNIGTADYVETPVLPSRTAFGMRFSIYNNAAWVNGNTASVWKDSSGNDRIRLQNTASGQQTLQFWNGAGWTNVGVGQTVTDTLNYRLEIIATGLNTASGTITARYINGSEAVVASWSGTGLNFSSITNFAQFRHYTKSGGIMTLAEALIQDGDAAAHFVHTNIPTGNGSDTGGTGTFADVDDGSGGPTDTDFISLPSAGDRRSVTYAARSLGGRKVNGVGVAARLRCGATGPQKAKFYVIISAVRYYSPDITLTTLLEPYQYVWELNPATGLAWTNAEAEAASLNTGVEAVT